MPERAHQSSVSLRLDQPLIGIVLREHNQEMVRFFADEGEADATLPEDSIQGALGLAGVWSDLDWDAMEVALDHLRHESPPSPPISL